MEDPRWFVDVVCLFFWGVLGGLLGGFFHSRRITIDGNVLSASLNKIYINRLALNHQAFIYI